MAALNRVELQHRTKQFGRRVMKGCDAVPRSRSANVIANQLWRSATAVGANYRSACRARSSADGINQLGLVIEEADESADWLELIIEGELLPAAKATAVLKEADELTASFTASPMTSKRHTAKKS
jgi:four helix bundle protein